MRRWLLPMMLAMAVAAHAQVVEESFARDPGPLDFIRGEGFEQAIAQALAGDALVGLDARNQVVPRLADRWEQRGGWIRFHLRPGASFADGAPVRAEDAAWTFRQIQRDAEASPTKRMILEGVEVRTGGGFFEVRSGRPAQRLLMELARIPIARKGHPSEGSGPYLPVRTGTEWSFTARDHFLHPRIRAFHFRLVPDDQAQLLHLQKGWLSLGVPPARKSLLPPPGYRELRQPTHAQLLVWSRAGSAPLQALERWRSEAFPEGFFGAKARASRGLWPETLGFPLQKIDAPPPRPPAGQHWEILYSAGDELVQKALLALRERASKEGVDLEPRPVEAALLYQRLQKGDFQLATALNVFDPHPWSVLELLQKGGPLNFTGWEDPRAAILATRLDQPQAPAWRDLQRIWASHPAALPLLDLTSVVWVRTQLHVEPSALGLYLTTPGPAGWSWNP